MRLQVEFQSRLVHGLSSEDPLIFSKLGVEGSFLEPLHLEGEPRPELLQPGSCLLLFLLVYVSKIDYVNQSNPLKKNLCNLFTSYGRHTLPVMSDKNKVSLVVEGDHLTPLVLRVLHERTSTSTQSINIESKPIPLHKD